MIVIVLSAAPASLRGALTRWLAQVDAGVFVGHLSARVRDQLWELIEKNIGSGRALMVYSAANEQGMAIRTLGHEAEPIDLDGMTVMRTLDHAQASPLHLPGATTGKDEGWSIAGRRRRFRSAGVRALRAPAPPQGDRTPSP